MNGNLLVRFLLFLFFIAGFGVVSCGAAPEEAVRKTLIDFIARDNPKVRDVKAEEILDDGIIRELDESVFIKGLGLK
jgi:hypothetical protein